MGNLNDDANSSRYYDDKISSINPLQDSMLKSVNGSSGYDKEKVKRIMLAQESTFKNQVQELHRVYKRQRELMHGLKMSKANGFSVPVNTSQPNFLSYQLSSDVARKAWLMPHLTNGNISYDRGSSSTSEFRPLLGIIKENSVSSAPSINRISVKDRERRNSEHKKMFDLQLPADEYINSGLESRNDSQLKNDMPRRLFDLNEPAEDSCFDEEYEGFQGNQLSGYTSHQHEDFCVDLKKEKEPFNKGKEKTKEEWPLFHNEVGQSRRVDQFFNPALHKSTMSPNPMLPTYNGAPETVPHQNIAETWSGYRTSYGIQLGEISTHFSNSNYSRLMPESFSRIEFPPCFGAASFSISSLFEPLKSTDLNRNLSSNLVPVSEISSSRNGFHSGFLSNSSSSAHLHIPQNASPYLDARVGSSSYGNMNPAMSLDSNQALGNGVRGVLAAQQDLRWNHGGLSWYGTEHYHHLMNGHHSTASELDEKQEKGKDLPLYLHTDGFETQRNEAFDVLNGKRILGSPLLDKVRRSATINHTDSVAENSLHHISLNSVLSSMTSFTKQSPVSHQAKSKTKKDPSNKTRDRPVRVAAENLVAMSSGHALVPALPSDSLRWFADIVTSNADVGNESTDENGMDYFESMTLKLEPVKPEEYRGPLLEPESLKDEEGPAAMLPALGRKGQGKRRRQRRDFQKDILPSIATLTRNEVGEDLYALGLTRTSCRASRARLAKQNQKQNPVVLQRRKILTVDPPPPAAKTEVELTRGDATASRTITKQYRRRAAQPVPGGTTSAQLT